MDSVIKSEEACCSFLGRWRTLFLFFSFLSSISSEASAGKLISGSQTTRVSVSVKETRGREGWTDVYVAPFVKFLLPEIMPTFCYNFAINRVFSMNVCIFSHI